MSFASVRHLGFASALLVLEITACSGSEPTSSTNGASGTNGPNTSSATVGTNGAASTATTAATVGGSVTTNVTASGVTATSASSASASTGATTASATVTGSVTSGTASTTGAGGNTSASTTDSTVSTTGGSSDAVVSDDFESVAAGSPPDAAVWQLRLPSGGTSSIEVSAEEAHSGSQSVKVVGNSGSTLFFTENVFPLPAGVVHFRVWMRFTDANWSNHNAFVASGPGEESQEVRFGGQNNAYHANLSADGDGLSPNPYESPECPRCVAPVANEWKCLRGKLDFANNAAELYVGEDLAVDSAADGWHSGTGTFPANPTQIGFGWALYGAMANTVYYDDLAIGYEPIACE